MNRNSAETYLQDVDTDSELSLSDFMSYNYEHDPDGFVEPEDRPDYGPPGMPTPFAPMDPRIASRQLEVSASLRGLLLDPHLKALLGDDMVGMLTMNFDSHNTILGVANSDSYYRWSHQNRAPLPPELHAIEEKAVLGLADEGNILDLMLHHDDSNEDIKDLKSAELFKIYHLAKSRMRHLQPRRENVKQAILERGGTLCEDDQYSDLKLFPYVVVTTREMTDDERRECHMRTTSAEKKIKLLTSGKTDPTLVSPELFDAITDEINRDSFRVAEIMASTQVHTIKGAMASVKRRVGEIQKSNGKVVHVVERQLFAVDVRNFDGELIEALHHVRALRDEAEKNQNGHKPVIDEKSLPVYDRVYTEFKNATDIVIPVSTATYASEKDRNVEYAETVTRAIARVAIRSRSSGE